MKKSSLKTQAIKGNSKISEYFNASLAENVASKMIKKRKKCPNQDEAQLPGFDGKDITNCAPNTKKVKHNGTSVQVSNLSVTCDQICSKDQFLTNEIEDYSKKEIDKKSPTKMNHFNVQTTEKLRNLTPSKKNNMSPKKYLLYECTNCQVSPSKSEIPELDEQQILPKSKELVTSSNFLNNSQGVLDDWQSAFNLLRDDEDLTLPEDNNILNFEQPEHCKVMKTEISPNYTCLRLRSSRAEKYGTCYLEGFWINNYIEVGKTVYVHAVKRADNRWVIDNESGWIIYEPDLLISGTAVVGSLFCKRRSVLSEHYQGFDKGNKYMLIGNLVHLLLQSALRENLKSAAQIDKKLNEICSSKKMIKNLYETGVTFQDLDSELKTFIPRIIEFIQHYVDGKPQTVPKVDNWIGKITAIDDIEENIWCPELGLKGKVDVTVNANSSTMPLELKTGRATMSLEHRGQVILYIMMMNKLGYKVSSGLLLYLREDVLKEIAATPQEQRDILILRNELAYYLSKSTAIKKHDTGKHVLFLPEPINHHSACGKCPYNIICTSHLRYHNYDFHNNKALKEINSALATYLSEEHLNYFMTWSRLLHLESGIKIGEKSVQEIYTIEPKHREKSGKCIINLKIKKIEESNDLYQHIFEKEEENAATNFLCSGISLNNYIIVSTGKRPAVATGFVINITDCSITLSLDRNLNRKFSNEIFHLDVYDSSASVTFNLSSLAILLENTTRAKELREIIIDRTPPTLSSKLPAVVAKRGAPILKKLNPIQQRAVLKAISTKNYFLIKGMPGTGKTATIVALIRLLVALNKSVILTSHTHSAVDNVCVRLINHKINFIRLGPESKIQEKVKNYSEHYLTKNCKSVEELEQIYNSHNVIAVTCLGSGHPLLSKRIMDFCVVDESSQVLQTSIIRPIYLASAFILIGDPEQLAPVVKNKEAINGGMTESLFERLNTKESTIALTLNYRMNKKITDVANILTYGGELQPANDIISNNTLKIPKLKEITSECQNEPWLLEVLDDSLEKSVQFIDTGPVWKLSSNRNLPLKEISESQNCINMCEANIVKRLVEILIKGGVSNNDIGVIATYRAQVAQISSMLMMQKIEINTVDQFQGRDKNVIIYSCTKSKDTTSIQQEMKYELLEDKRRLTVAITRAKQKLLLVGDRSTLITYTTFSKIFEHFNDKNFITVLS